jgi:hypothetical protein
MMHIFNAEVCYCEYCEYEFDNEWGSIYVNEDDDNSSVFYVREVEI